MEAAFQNVLLELSTFFSPGGGKVFKMISHVREVLVYRILQKLCLGEQPCCEEFISTKSEIQ